MLFIRIVTWAPERRGEVVKIITEALRKDPLPDKHGTQKIWWDASGNRLIELVDSQKPLEPKGMLELFGPYLSIFQIQEIPVMEIQEALEVISKA